jgi:GNAT superfamily N-acetyltransferase
MMEIRKAARTDAPVIWKLRNSAILAQCVDDYPLDVLNVWTSSDMPEGFADDVESSFHAVFRGEALIGFGKIDLKSGTIDAVFVHPDHFRTGVGRKLLAYLEKLAVQSGLSNLRLESTLDAAVFYRAQGFHGDKIGVYISPRGIALSCVPMTKILHSDGV